jgi:3-oxoacyl-[acyl-carrier-protein] synthase-1
MTGVFIKGNNMISALGFSQADHIAQLTSGSSGIIQREHPTITHLFVAPVDDSGLQQHFESLDLEVPMSRLEKMMAISISQACGNDLVDLADPKTGFIFSTTKGNIDLLDKPKALDALKSSLLLESTARKVWKALGGGDQQPLVVCNACISGLVAIIKGARMIESGIYDQVVVTGADVLSEFIISGFNALKALGDGPCRPFDKGRSGISLGEGCGTVMLSKNGSHGDVRFLSGSISNDANHISGPSRTASGLVQAVEFVQARTKVLPDYISAHGTATLYNDEMEAIGLQRLGLQNIPVNSFKGYWGHTLGAAGILETLAGCYSLQEDRLFASAGFQQQGTSETLQIIEKTTNKKIDRFLKTSSGFGGCNAVAMFEKYA